VAPTDAVAAADAQGSVHRYPCEACGADLRFSPGATALVCDHCGHTQLISPSGHDRLRALRELDYAAAAAGTLPDAAMEEVRSAKCESCGAEVAFDPAVHSKECPFCASPMVLDTGASRHIKPQGVLPFRLTEAEARRALLDWLGRLWFAPSALRQSARAGRAMTGLYTPFWTFDARTASHYTGRRGDHYYETRTVHVTVNGRREARQERVQRTRWTAVSGRVARDFDDVIVLASKALPRGHVEALAPWDLGALEPYRPDYLAGFRAEGYTVGLAEGHEIARARMAQVIEADVRRAIGGDVQEVHAIRTEWRDETFKHILLPVWLAAYRFRGKVYRIVINGQTGRVRGERPWSWVKIAIAALLAAVLLGGGLYLAERAGLLEGGGTGTIWSPGY
jgi:predicted RNA-binding Zn-ribbon protein involved in translation (DUF1610 family)